MSDDQVFGAAASPVDETGRRRVWWSRVAAAVVTVTVAATVPSAVVGASTAGGSVSEVVVSFLVVSLFAWLGALIVSRQPHNRIAWLLIAIGAGIAYSGMVDEIQSWLASLDPSVLAMTPRVWTALWSAQWANLAFILPVLLLLYVFPTGSLLSRNWRWAPGLMLAMLFTGLLFSTFAKEFGLSNLPSDQVWSIANPIGVISDAVVNTVFGLPWLVAELALPVGGVVSMVVRYRRSADVGRTQIKWVLFAFVFFALAFGVFLFANFRSSDSFLFLAVLIAGVAALPVSITVAVLKFHLYEIDVIISRSITFGVLAVFIGGVYVGIVVGVGSLFGQADGSNVGLSVAATAVVALVFQPVRGWVERWANRLVYGKRATPYEVLARFSHRSAEESDEDVLVRISRLIVDGTGVSSAMVWVRSGGGFRTASVWPESDAVRTLDGDVGFVDPDADVSWPVFHDGELLGGISLVAARGGVITPPERELVTRLADGLGLTLRNSRLTAELRRQVKDLQRSRDRVVSAADEARRSLEHDLDSGPQQLLVAAKVKLGPLRKLAEQAGAVRTAEVLADIEVNAGEAIRAVRDFAAGIYPPLLGAEGLAVALGQETRKAALPVDLETDGVGRYSREVESAVYFSILEALQNTAKYAEASRAVVRLTAGNGDLRFEVSDDGRGFDPATLVHGAGINGIADRLDTIGGTWTITSSLGGGTTLTGTVPTETPVAI